MILMDNKAQAALEYLLIIAAAILVAAIAIIVMTSSIVPPTDAKNTYHTKYNKLEHSI